MYTVILCDANVINDCKKKFKVYLRPLLDNDSFSFCEWNPKGDSLETAAPSLRKCIHMKKEWRAIIVNTENTWSLETINTTNPFDVVQAKYTHGRFSSMEEIEAFRKEHARILPIAMQNPLTRLSVWLCGSPIPNEPTFSSTEEDRQMPLPATGEMAAAQASAMGLPTGKAVLEAYRAALKERGLTPEGVEADRARKQRYDALSACFVNRGELFNPPETVTAIALRAKDTSREREAAAWRTCTEFDYSKFYMDNLYPEKLRYVLYDIPYIRGMQNEQAYFTFLTSLLLFAQNECPSGAIKAERVYSMRCEVDPDRIRELCGRYTSKLDATIEKVNSMILELENEYKAPIDRYTAEHCFEADTVVPVTINSEMDSDELYANSGKIGLATDCPKPSESRIFNEEFTRVNKFFVRYLREPRRALRSAAVGPFHAQNEIRDERAVQLNHDQLEDIACHLEEEERAMVETPTVNIFDLDGFRKRMDTAAADLKNVIAQRMTKKRTAAIGVIALLAYIVGFLPLLFSNVNTGKSFSVSLLILLAGTFIFALAGFIALFCFRKKVSSGYRRFNLLMQGLVNEIRAGLDNFSDYLSHACNVMREFSVLRAASGANHTRLQILLTHRQVLNACRQEANELFADYMMQDPNAGIREYPDEKPYDYDFASPREYIYDMPHAEKQKRIVFLQAGNMIAAPVDYLHAVTLNREELYD